MKTIRLILLAATISVISSCGLFKKDCGCPHFGKAPSHSAERPFA